MYIRVFSLELLLGPSSNFVSIYHMYTLCTNTLRVCKVSSAFGWESTSLNGIGALTQSDMVQHHLNYYSQAHRRTGLHILVQVCKNGGMPGSWGFSNGIILSMTSDQHLKGRVYSKRCQKEVAFTNAPHIEIISLVFPSAVNASQKALKGCYNLFNFYEASSKDHSLL
jgi:hypothetical protein